MTVTLSARPPASHPGRPRPRHPARPCGAPLIRFSQSLPHGGRRTRQVLASRSVPFPSLRVGPGPEVRIVPTHSKDPRARPLPGRGRSGHGTPPPTVPRRPGHGTPPPHRPPQARAWDTPRPHHPLPWVLTAKVALNPAGPVEAELKGAVQSSSLWERNVAAETGDKPVFSLQWDARESPSVSWRVPPVPQKARGWREAGRTDGERVDGRKGGWLMADEEVGVCMRRPSRG